MVPPAMKHLVLLAIAATLLFQACSSSTPSTDGATCPPPDGCPTPDPATKQLTSPVVSFKTDVAPLFQTSCALSGSCHQQQTGGPSQLYLGPPPNQAGDPAGVYAAIVNKPSVELSSMPYVKPSDLANSFLMHKMDGDICQFASQCGATPAASCGVVMPQSGCALDGATRDKVRRWIAQGAQNN
jgi:hypothetical protein